jgi:hypothetical protein
MPSKRSGKSVRRDASAPGLTALTIDDFESYARGEISLSALADRCGVSRQAVSERFRRLTWSKTGSSTTSLPAAGAAPPPAPAAPTAIPADTIVIDDPAELRRVITREIDRVDLKLLQLVGRSIDHWHDNGTMLGPTNLKALATALTTLRTNLGVAGLVQPPDDSEAVQELRVRTLTPEEEKEIRRQAEAGDVEDGDELVLEDGRDDDEHEDEAVGLPENSVEPNAPPAVPARRGIITDPLPDASRFPAWLIWLAKHRGDRHLREIVAGLTGALPTGDGADLPGKILALTGSDPRKLGWLT